MKYELPPHQRRATLNKSNVFPTKDEEYDHHSVSNQSTCTHSLKCGCGKCSPCESRKSK